METEAIVQRARLLREKLHRTPEASGCEAETKRALIGFLKAESDPELVDRGKWFYAAHREDAASESILLRADMDAVTGADGRPFHGCGHDGHSAVMAALAASTGGRRFGKNLFFLFQHAEETGAGAAECCEIFDNEKIDRVFGFHNCPGFPAGSVLLLHDTFACASKGLILRFEGSQSHAAYPENGRNPVFPMAAFFSRWQALTDPSLYGGMVLATPVCVTAGSRSFGVAAGSGEIDLTLRAWRDGDLKRLAALVKITAQQLALQAGIGFRYEEQDVFPATVKDPAQYEGLTLATPVCVAAGTRSFGVAAGSGEIDLTLRAWRDEDMKKLQEGIADAARELAASAGITLTVSEEDVFPATVNDPALLEMLKTAAEKAGLQTLTPREPFRWSEDFGHYGACCPACFCGFGAGEDAAGLHTPDYRWNDAVTESAVKLFSELIHT